MFRSGFQPSGAQRPPRSFWLCAPAADPLELPLGNGLLWQTHTEGDSEEGGSSRLWGKPRVRPREQDQYDPSPLGSLPR